MLAHNHTCFRQMNAKTTTPECQVGQRQSGYKSGPCRTLDHRPDGATNEAFSP